MAHAVPKRCDGLTAQNSTRSIGHGAADDQGQALAAVGKVFNADLSVAGHRGRARHQRQQCLLPAQRPQQWWAGAHTDYDCLTLLFQRNQQRGLEVCCDQTKETQTWSPVIPDEGLITCNIGDMLMRWSDDKLRSTLHRVAMPKGSSNIDGRHSMAFFCQANSRQTIYGQEGKYPPISAREYLKQRIATNSTISSPTKGNTKQ